MNSFYISFFTALRKQVLNRGTIIILYFQIENKNSLTLLAFIIISFVIAKGITLSLRKCSVCKWEIYNWISAKDKFIVKEKEKKRK